jgi:hypothetical protein
VTQHGQPAGLSQVIPTTYEVERSSEHRHVAVACCECNSQNVQIVAVQARTGERRHPKTLRVDLYTGEAINEDTPAPGRDAATSSRTRIGLTFRCGLCGATWAAVFTQHAGATRIYRSSPTIS